MRGSPRSAHGIILLIRNGITSCLLVALAGICAQPSLARTETALAPRLDRDMAIRAGVSAPVLDLAMNAVSCGLASGDLASPPTLTLIDYSLPSASPAPVGL